jgi:hypothetical protein
VHFTARVLLTKQLREFTGTPVRPEGNVISAPDIYRVYFHGPAYQVVEKAWWDGKRIIGAMSGKLAANHHPSDLTTLVSPRLIELCFQTAGICEIGTDGRMGLPLHIDHLSFSNQIVDADKETCHAVVTRKPEQNSFDAEIVDASGKRHVQLRGYHTVSVPGAIDPQKLKALQAAMMPDLVAA